MLKQNKHKGIRVMTKEEKNKYLEAVDLVCINCIYKTGDECYSCLVRKSVDYHNNNWNIQYSVMAYRTKGPIDT